MQEAQGQSLIREVGSHMPCEVAKKKKKKKKKQNLYASMHFTIRIRQVTFSASHARKGQMQELETTLPFVL